jgi:hypothetical protein
MDNTVISIFNLGQDFFDLMQSYKNKLWFIDLEGSSTKTTSYSNLFGLKDGIVIVEMEYRHDNPATHLGYALILLKFKAWNDEISDYEDYPSCTLIVKTKAPKRDFEGVAKEFIVLRRTVARITSNERITFADLVKRLEEEGVEFGI